MSDWLKEIIRATGLATAIAVPGPLIAGGDFGGVWQPYSMPALWLGTMTVESDRLSFEAGPTARIEPVREDGSVFRIIEQQYKTLFECGHEPENYVGFHVLDNGLLARLDYRADKPPAEPTGSNSMEVIRNGACAVMFYAR
ncbi:MAG: hypothetical protein ACQEXC_09585 [Pseudomonadota bacterium]